jgi:hypothetical protein
VQQNMASGARRFASLWRPVAGCGSGLGAPIETFARLLDARLLDCSMLGCSMLD